MNRPGDASSVAVLVDALSARTGGGINYLANLLPALVRRPEIGRVEVVVAADSPLVARLDRTQVEVRQIEPRSPRLGSVLLWEARGLGRAAAGAVVLSPNAMLPRRLPGPVVAVPHNILPFLEHGPLNRVRRRAILRTLGWASGAIYVSEEMRRRVQRLSRRPALYRVIPHGLHEAFRAPAPRQPGRAGVVCVCDRQPHKRLDLLITVWRRLGSGAPRLTVIGAEGVAPAAPGVVFDPSLRPDQIAEAMRRAAMVVLPSVAESFGLPAVEALACRAPLLASDIPALREVTGGHATYVKSDRAEVWAEGIEAMLASPPPTESGREWALRFSWERCAASTAGLLADAHRLHARAAQAPIRRPR